MFETLTLTTLLLIGFFFWQYQRLGLSASLPQDPGHRARFFCSECLTSLKNLLPQSTILELEPESVLFTPRGSQTTHRLISHQGKLLLALEGGPLRPVGTLGQEGRVHFEKASESCLKIEVDAQVEEAQHQACLRLEVNYA